MGSSGSNELKNNNGSNNTIVNSSEKRLGKSIINSLLGKFELFERKEIEINIESPDKNFKLTKKVLNTELVTDIIHDLYKYNSSELIATLNGYIITQNLSLKDNLVQNNDTIFISEPLFIIFSLTDGNEFLIKVSPYQIFLDAFEKFIENECPKCYRNKLYEAYYNNRLIQPSDMFFNLGIREKERINIILGKDDNTKSIYNKGTETLNRINYRYFDGKKQISINDNKFELSKQNLDDRELNNIGLINFRNLKILILNDCNIQNLDFINTYNFSNLEELNLQKNKISYLVDIIHYNLQKLDLSHNNLKNNMVKPEINDNYNNISTVRLNKVYTLVFPKLYSLNLSYNKITNISLLSQFNANALKELDLSYNAIKNIDVLTYVPFGSLKNINLSSNKIEELNAFNKLAFCNNIEIINLMNNEIVNLNVLREVSLPNLKMINLLNNDINDFSVLRLIYFPKLKIIYVFPSQLNPNNYDKNSQLFINFNNSCKHIIEKNIEVNYKI